MVLTKVKSVKAATYCTCDSGVTPRGGKFRAGATLKTFHQAVSVPAKVACKDRLLIPSLSV